DGGQSRRRLFPATYAFRQSAQRDDVVTPRQILQLLCEDFGRRLIHTSWPSWPSWPAWRPAVRHSAAGAEAVVGQDQRMAAMGQPHQIECACHSEQIERSLFDQAPVCAPFMALLRCSGRQRRRRVLPFSSDNLPAASLSAARSRSAISGASSRKLSVTISENSPA